MKVKFLLIAVLALAGYAFVYPRLYPPELAGVRRVETAGNQLVAKGAEVHGAAVDGAVAKYDGTNRTAVVNDALKSATEIRDDAAARAALINRAKGIDQTPPRPNDY